MLLKRYYLIVAYSITMAFTSCSIEKRIYRPGYHITWNHTAKDNGEAAAVNTEKQAEANANIAVTADAGETIAPLPAEKPLIIEKEIPDSCGDVITMRNGTSVTAQVTEVSPTEIKYKRCDNINGPSYTVNKNEIASIQYHNGVKETFEQKQESPQHSASYYYEKHNSAVSKTNAKISHDLGIAALIAAVLCLLFIGSTFLLFMSDVSFLGFITVILSIITLILAIVFGIVSLVGNTISKKKDNSDDEELKKQRKTGKIAGLIAVVIAGLVAVAAIGTVLFADLFY